MHNFAFIFLCILTILFFPKSNFKLHFSFFQIILKLSNYVLQKGEHHFMEQLQHQWISGNVPKNVLSDNMKNFTSFPLSTTADDGFLHLLGKGIYSFPTNCSLTFQVEAPYHFFYIYEGTLSVSDEKNTCRLTDRCTALLPISGNITVEILKGRCRYFHMYVSGLSLAHFHQLLPSALSYPSESASMFTLFHTMEHLQNLSEESAADSLFLCRTSMWITDILTEMAIYSSSPTKKRDTIPDYLQEIHHLFDTQYKETYSLDELENTYSVSKYRICREFSKYYGVSPVQYLNHKRMEEAKKLLLTTNETVHEIGSMVGIHNTNHFINLFKRETGATPLAFKQDAPVSISELHYL